MDASSSLRFSPFYQRNPFGGELTLPQKIIVSLALFAAHACLVVSTLSTKNQKLFYDHKLWLLGAIAGTVLFCLYVATASFQRLLPLMSELHNSRSRFQSSIDNTLSDSNFLILALCFGVLNTVLGHCFGLPDDYGDNTSAVVVIYAGFFMTGFIGGMAVCGILGVASLFNRLAGEFRGLLDYHDPDGCGGLSGIGSAIAVFGVVTLMGGVLISLFLTAMPWIHTNNPWARMMLWTWIVFPYVMCAIVVAIPAVALYLQLANYQYEQRRRLSADILAINNTMEKLRSDGADIATLKSRLDELREELKTLHAMRLSPLNRETYLNFIAAIVPNVLGSSIAMESLTEIIKKNPVL